MGILNILSSLNITLLSASNSVVMAFITVVFGITTFKEFLLIRSSYTIMLNFITLLPTAINGFVIGKDSMDRLNEYLKESFVY